jgi:Tfp pilus assembly protein PilF
VDNINKSPRLSRPHSNLGIIYFLHNENEKALKEYEKALSLNNFGKRKILGFQYYNMGLLYFEEMQDAQAMDYFKKSAAINPDDVQNDIYMAKIHLRHDRIKDARQMVESKLKKYPHNAELSEIYRIIQLKEGS